MTLALALRSLARHPIRTVLVVVGVAVAAALLLDMVMLSGGMERSFERMLLSRGFQIRLSPKGTLPFDTEAHLVGVGPIVEALRRDPDLESVGPVVAAPLRLPRTSQALTVVGYGVDPEAQGLYQLVRGADLATGDTTGLVISEAVARLTAWSPGDSATVQGRLDPGSGRPAGERRMVVRGVVRFIYESRDQLSVAAAFGLVQRLARFPNPDPASMVMIRARPGADVAAVSDRIAARYPGIAVNSIATLVAQFRTRLAYFKQLSLILATISVVVGVLLIATILTITVGERLGEFAVLRALGFRRRRVVELVLIEGAVVAATGALAGLGLGIATARYLDRILTSFPGLPAAISFFVPEPRSLTAATLGVLLLGVGASAYPAWRAAGAPIAPTLRAAAE